MCCIAFSNFCCVVCLLLSHQSFLILVFEDLGEVGKCEGWGKEYNEERVSLQKSGRIGSPWCVLPCSCWECRIQVHIFIFLPIICEFILGGVRHTQGRHCHTTLLQLTTVFRTCLALGAAADVYASFGLPAVP